MPLKRITLATETLQDFVALSSAKQKILVFLLSNRNMREKPMRPTNYFSYEAIAEETSLKASTVRVLIIGLTKEGWLTRQNHRVQYTPAGEPENQFRWCISKVLFELEEAYKKEAEEVEQHQTHFDVGDAPDYLLLNGYLWRVGGPLGWQRRKQNSRNREWADLLIAPDEVIDFFS